jgi:hypothetical protein
MRVLLSMLLKLDSLIFYSMLLYEDFLILFL